MARYRLVRFRGGGYGVAKGLWFFTEFVDLKNPDFCWTERSDFFKDCVGSREQAERVLRLITTPLYTYVD